MKRLGCLVALLVVNWSTLAHADGGPLALEYVSTKAASGWTAVTVAIRNKTKAPISVRCCEAFVENGQGYAVASLETDDISRLNNNKARTAAKLGGLLGAGLGLGGAIGGVDELVYAGVATGVASGVAATVGEAKQEGNERDLIIDNLQRVRKFPPGLKVAGVIYFPPTKKWPGSKQAKAVHLTYTWKGGEYKATALTH